MEGSHQVDNVGGQFRLGAFIFFEVLQCGIAPDSFFNLLLLQKHLRRAFEFLVFKQALNQLIARVLLHFRRSVGIMRQKHL